MSSAAQGAKKAESVDIRHEVCGRDRCKDPSSPTESTYCGPSRRNGHKGDHMDQAF